MGVDNKFNWPRTSTPKEKATIHDVKIVKCIVMSIKLSQHPECVQVLRSGKKKGKSNETVKITKEKAIQSRSVLST